jgi:hypothetical protein
MKLAIACAACSASSSATTVYASPVKDVLAWPRISEITLISTFAARSIVAVPCRAVPRIAEADRWQRDGERDRRLRRRPVPAGGPFGRETLRIAAPPDRGVPAGEPAESFRDVAGAQSAAVLVGEDPPGGGVGAAPGAALEALPLLPGGEGACGLLVEDHLPLGLLRLGVVKLVLGLRLADAQPPGRGAEVWPFQPGKFPAAWPVVGGQVEQGVQPLTRGLGEVGEVPALAGGPVATPGSVRRTCQGNLLPAALLPGQMCSIIGRPRNVGLGSRGIRAGEATQADDAARPATSSNRLLA